MRQFTAGDVAQRWPFPDAGSDKYSRGVVGLDTGSEHYPGAGLLSCGGALHAGAGMVRYLGGAPRELILARFPSVVLADGQVEALVLGSGWGPLADARRRLDDALGRSVPLVIDADALRLLPADLPDGCLLTPHAGELARLLGVGRSDVESHPVEHAKAAATRFGATVLLKGGIQYVVTPDGEVASPVRGPAWTAQAGSGDTLAGACGTLLAAGMSASDAALLAASLQAMTAAKYPGPHPPDRLAEHFADVVGGLPKQRSGH